MDSLIFEPETHSYKSLGADIDWISVTTLIGQFKQPFDADAVASKSSRNSKSKWYNMTVEDIKACWKAESDRACNLGTWYHDEREKDLLSCNSIVQHGKELNVIAPIYDELNRKKAPSQKLGEGIYPEHMVYMKSAGVCGQSDLVEVTDGKVFITDYKTNKEIKESSYKNWEGISQKMLNPVSHLDDCNYNHYNLQLSLYMYIILKHNPKLSFGGLLIHHIKFEERDQKDEMGFPIIMETSEGKPIVKEVVHYSMPYLKDEIHAIMWWLKDNKDKIKKK